MAVTLQSSEAVPFNETEFGISLFQGQHVMDDIRAQINKIDHQELKYLNEHKQTMRRRFHFHLFPHFYL